MEISQGNLAAQKRPVTLFTGKKSAVPQPEGFRVCPMGMQLYSKRKMKEFELLEFTISVPTKDGGTQSITCTGVVVHCQPDKKSMHRVWVKFLDLPEDARKQIECVSKKSKLLCPYCENF